MSANQLERDDLDGFTRVLHAGLTGLGLLAWLTGELAGDYKKLRHLGFDIHSWLGISLSLFILLRIIYGFIGPPEVRFSQWLPYNKERLALVWEDLQTLLRLQLPQRPAHQGLKALIQGFGLAVFAWMALTGSLMFFYLEPGHRARGMLHLIKEVHEIGHWLIPIFLGLHLSGVLLDAWFGQGKWRKMFFLAE